LFIWGFAMARLSAVLRERHKLPFACGDCRLTPTHGFSLGTKTQARDVGVTVQ